MNPETLIMGVIESPLPVRDWLAISIFFLTWFAYARFAKFRAKRQHTLSSIMRAHREDWMRQVMLREQRVSDATILGNLERVVTFFASTTILLLAGTLTAIMSADRLVEVINSMHLADAASVQSIRVKLFFLALIFVYAFFKFTWAVRQYIMCAILLGGAPIIRGEIPALPLSDELEGFAVRAAKMSDLANHDFNHGLRAYYFALALLGWLINVWVLLIAGSLVIATLAQREFFSKAVRVLREA
jgi:uncharacterized membrane protein